MKGLKGKNALITGASTGIGEAIAIRLAQEGVNVAVNYRKSVNEAEETVEKMQNACSRIRDCGVKDLLVQADVSKEENILAMFSTVIAEFGGIDILVNNAGIQYETPAHEITAADFDQIIGVNLRGSFLCAREVLKHFLETKRQGTIINISSVHEIIPRPKYLSYSISKGGMGNLTKTLALEYAEQGIRVNGVAPGATITPINEAWTEDPAKQAEVASHIPMKRVGTSEEMAAAVAFLASEESAYMTGQTLFIDGGLTLYQDFQEPWSA